MRALITIFLMSATWLSAQPFSLVLGTGLASATGESGGTSYTLKDYVAGSGTTYSADMLNWYYYAFRWQASNSYTLRTNVISAYYAGGVPAKYYTNLVYSDSAGSVGTLLTGGTSNARAGSTCPSSEGKWAFDGLSCSITSGNYYWTVIAMEQGGYEAGGNIVKFLLLNEIGYPAWKKSDTASSWTDDIPNVRLRYETWGN